MVIAEFKKLLKCKTEMLLIAMAFRPWLMKRKILPLALSGLKKARICRNGNSSR